jgi:hypothetical protein
LKGLSFDATIVNCLSMLLLDFIIPPATEPPSSALASFPIPSNSFELWHRRFGHLGQDATRDVLTKDYATGIKYIPSPNVALRCIPCLIGKSPQIPFPHHAKCATVICELIHVDTCGPFPTLTPCKEGYFTIYLSGDTPFRLQPPTSLFPLILHLTFLPIVVSIHKSNFDILPKSLLTSDSLTCIVGLLHFISPY